MKLIIAGSRDLNVSTGFIWNSIEALNIPKMTEIVSGKASGVDTCGENFAKTMHLLIKEFPADWTKHGKAAGPIRNREMANYADALLLIWDGSSRGSDNMKKSMMALNKPIYEVILKCS